jgi:type II secretory pathway pseudopilin PulG
MKRSLLTRTFTLIELLVVVLILATTAGLVISRLDWVQGSTESAASATGSAQVHNNLQVYKTNKREWPTGFDSLIDPNGGTPQVLTTVFGEVLPSPTLDWLEVSTFTTPAVGPPTNNPVYSLTKLGLDTVYDHDPTVTHANASGVTLRAFSAFDPTDDVFATVIEQDGAGDPTRIVAALYPAGIPTDVTLIALGVGQSCSAVGVTMASAPISAATDPNAYYSRFIALYACYDDGRSAQLKAVVDSSGTVIGDQLQAYSQASPE